MIYPTGYLGLRRNVNPPLTMKCMCSICGDKYETVIDKSAAIEPYDETALHLCDKCKAKLKELIGGGIK